MIIKLKILLLITTLPFLLAKYLQAAEPEFSLRLELEQNVVHLGSDVKGTIILTNISDHDRQFYIDRSRGAHQSGFKIDVHDAQGKIPQLTIQGSLVVGSPGNVMLKPNQTVKYKVNVTKLYQIVDSGVYTIQAQRLDDITKTMVISNVVDFTMTQ